jgi:hypothetical protein
MKNILTFDQFINESYGVDFDAFDANDEALIFELKHMYNMFKDGIDTEESEMYENNLLEFFLNYDGGEDFTFINEDEADDLDKDMKVRAAQGMGDKGAFKKAISFLAWAAFPIKAPYELIKLISKKNKIRKLLKNIPEGPKKDKLRAELNDLDKQQVTAVADLKKARTVKSYASTYGEEMAKKFKVEDSVQSIAFDYINSLYEAGKMTADQKEKVMKKAEGAGKAEAKGVVKKAEEIAKKVGAADSDKKAQIMDKMKSEIEAKKKAWEDVKKKAEAEGIKI